MLSMGISHHDVDILITSAYLTSIAGLAIFDIAQARFKANAQSGCNGPSAFTLVVAYGALIFGLLCLPLFYGFEDLPGRGCGCDCKLGKESEEKNRGFHS